MENSNKNNIKELAKELCEKSGCHHKCHDTKDCVVEDEAKAIIGDNLPFALTNEGKVSEKVKQIEEMAKVICPCIYDFNDCENCDLYDSKRCLPFNIAKELDNAGYRKQNKWISVKDRLPSECGKYLGCTEKGTIIIVRYYTTDGGFFGYHNLCTITHWMPLPEAPKMKGGE